MADAHRGSRVGAAVLVEEAEVRRDGAPERQEYPDADAQGHRGRLAGGSVVSAGAVTCDRDVGKGLGWGGSVESVSGGIGGGRRVD